MKDQVVMSKHNCELAVAVPLYRKHHSENIASLEGYEISLTKDEPLAYAVDMGDHIWLFNKEIVETQCVFLGEL